MLDKTNLQMKIGQLIVNDLHKTNAPTVKVENMLHKVIKQLKLEKANSIAINSQVDELKKIIVKIGVNRDDQLAIQKLFQSAKPKIGILRKKLNHPTSEHPIATGIAEVENEKEKILEDVLWKIEEISVLKEALAKLQKQVDTHVYTVVMPANTKDLVEQVMHLGT